MDSRETSHHIGALVYPHSAAMKSKSGFRPGPGASPGLVTATGTPDANVHVAPFQLLLQNIRGSGFGCYITCLDAIKDINILSTPADPTNPRNDLIVAQQSDIFDSDANSDFLVRHVVGTPAASPADPSVSGSTNYITLARVRVNATATSINSGNITDLRTTGHAKSLTGGLYTVASGGLLPVASQAERDALTGLYDGLKVWRSDLKREDVYNSTTAAWRPASPYRSKQVLSGTAASVTFSSIPGDCTMLRITAQARGDTAASFTTGNMRFNGDTSSIYESQSVGANGATVAGAESLANSAILIGEVTAATATANTAAAWDIFIPNYTGTTFWKQAISNHILSTLGNTTLANHSKQFVGRWRNTAAITSVTLFPGAGNFIAGSYFMLEAWD